MTTDTATQVPAVVNPHAVPAHIAAMLATQPVDQSDIQQYMTLPSLKLKRANTQDDAVRNMCDEGQPYIMQGEPVKVVEMIPDPNKPGRPSLLCVPFTIIPVFSYSSWACLEKGNYGSPISMTTNPKDMEAINAQRYFGKTVTRQVDDGRTLEVSYREALNWVVYLPHMDLVCRVGFSSTAFPVGSKLAKMIMARRPAVEPPMTQFQLFTKMYDNPNGAPFPNWEVATPKEGGWNMDSDLIERLMLVRQQAKEKHAAGLLMGDSPESETSSVSNEAIQNS